MQIQAAANLLYVPLMEAASCLLPAAGLYLVAAYTRNRFEQATPLMFLKR